MKGLTTVLLILVVALSASTGYLGYRAAIEPTAVEVVGELTKDELSTMEALVPVISFSVDDIAGEIGGEAFIDDLDREVSIDSAVERIVCLNPAATETIFSLEADSKLVAVSDAWGSWVTTPQDVACEIEAGISIGELTALNAFSIDPEVIIGLEPDVVFAFGYTLPEYAEAIQDIVPVICFAPTTLEDVLQNLVLIGKVVGKEAEAQDMVGGIKAEIIDIANVTIDKVRPKVFCEIDCWGGIYTTGNESFISSLIILAGGDDIGTAVSTDNPIISPEYIVDSQPEIIILLDYPWSADATTVAARSGWDSIPAIQNNEIYEVEEVSEDKITVPGPRIAEGLKVLLGIIHPELSE